MDKVVGNVNTINTVNELAGEKGLKIVGLNVRSIFKKIDQCRIMFSCSGIDIVTLSETWLKTNVPTKAIDVDNYCTIRQDRNLARTTKKAGGGLITYIHTRHKDKIQTLDDLSESNQNYEALWVRLNMPQCRDIVICNFYRPPSGKLEKTIKYLEHCLASINSNKTDIFITGDFNVDYSNKRSAEYKALSFFAKSNQLSQTINEATRITDKSETTIDLIITNCKYVHKSGSLDTFVSDHRPTYIVKKKQRDARPKETFIGRSYRNFNEEDFRHTLANKDWGDILDESSTEKAWQTLYHEIIIEINRICPNKTFTVRAHKPEWLNNHLLEQMKDRDYFYKKAKTTQSADDWNIAKHLRNLVNSNIRQAKADFIHTELNSCRTDPKKFWRIINKVFPGKSKSHTNKIRIKDNSNVPVKEKNVPAYINDFFINIGSKIAEKNITAGNSVGNPGPVGPLLHNQVVQFDQNDLFELEQIKEVDVYKEVVNINIKKSSGLEEVNSRVMKEAFKALIPELTKIFNLSIQSTTVPNSWKSATVIPIPKTGDLYKVENYRPISLLPLPGKLLERVIHAQLESNLEDMGFFTAYQHGFRKKRSTTHAVLQLVNQVNQKMDRNTPTTAIFIDFRKAFDCVDHRVLLGKLENTNLGPKNIQWIKNYLSDRQQHVVANSLKSTSLPIKQGVPQGSTLGPLFYILYANDIPKDMKGQVSLYADHTVIFNSSKDKSKVEDNLQKDMDTLKCWCHSNKLTINTGKTKLMVFGHQKSRDKLGNVHITYEGNAIDEVTNYTYLGMKLDQSLKYDQHARATIQRVADKLRYLKRIRKFVTSTAALNIYKNMVLPILEFGNIFLVSANATLRKKLQTLQNKALKCALGLDPTTDTTEVHKLARLDKLKTRRDLQLTQIMFQQNENPSLWRKKKRRASGIMTRSSQKKQFITTRARTEKFIKSITNRAPSLWNALPSAVQNVVDLGLFKNQLRKHLAKKRERD